MKLSNQNVNEVVCSCLLSEDEMDGGNPRSGIEVVPARGIVSAFGFHKARLEERREDVRSMLEQLPDEFRESGGGGWSFLKMFSTKQGEHWGEHSKMDDLLALGIGLGLMKIQVPRDMWSMFPGGVPYVVYLDRPKEAHG